MPKIPWHTVKTVGKAIAGGMVGAAAMDVVIGGSTSYAIAKKLVDREHKRMKAELDAHIDSQRMPMMKGPHERVHGANMQRMVRSGLVRPLQTGPRGGTYYITQGGVRKYKAR